MAKEARRSRRGWIPGAAELAGRFGLSCLQRGEYRSELTYPIGQSGQCLIIRPSVLIHFSKYPQRDPHSLEAGGQLFARFIEGNVVVEKVTGPRPSDLRFRHLYIPDRSKEQGEINVMHQEGFHFVGDWHTHPEPTPKPSPSDVRSIQDSFAKSKHHLNWFIMIIAGTNEFPSGLHIAAYSAADDINLVPDILLKDAPAISSI